MSDDKTWRKTTIYVPDHLRDLIELYRSRWESDGQSYAIHEVFHRYDAIMQQERVTIGSQFTKAEFVLMLNNALSTAYDWSTIAGAVLADTIDEGDDVMESYGVDRAALVAKLERLTPGQQFALVDWLEEERSKLS